QSGLYSSVRGIFQVRRVFQGGLVNLLKTFVKILNARQKKPGINAGFFHQRQRLLLHFFFNFHAYRANYATVLCAAFGSSVVSDWLCFAMTGSGDAISSNTKLGYQRSFYCISTAL